MNARVTLADLAKRKLARGAEAYRAEAARLVARAAISRDFDQPYLADRSSDGRTVYIDRRIPRLVAGVDTGKSLAWHELAEWAAMNDGMSYDAAHERIATPLEREEVERQGGDWKTYTEAMDGYVLETEHEKVQRVPADLDLRPYADDDKALLKKVVAAEDGVTSLFDRDNNAGALRPLYVRRDVINGQDIVDWAKDAGFKTALQPDDLHVTISFSRDPMDWSAVAPKSDIIDVVGPGDRSLERFGDAVVLRFSDPRLAARHFEFERAGASFDHPSYQPHVTITWNADGFNWGSVKPFDGPIVLGPEVYAPVKEDWKSTISEDADPDVDEEDEKKRIERQRARAAWSEKIAAEDFDPGEPRNEKGEWTSTGGITAFHGSPYDFDKFEASKIGSGEGAQAYGHGLYFAEARKVAEDYQSQLAQTKVSIEGRDLDELTDMFGGRKARDEVLAKITAYKPPKTRTADALDEVFLDVLNRLDVRVRHGTDANSALGTLVKADRERLDKASEDARKAGAAEVERNMPRGSLSEDFEREKFEAEASIEIANSLMNHVKAASGGALYQVRIKASPDEFLDWDAQLSKQPAAIGKFFAPIIKLAVRKGVVTGSASDPMTWTGEEAHGALVSLEPSPNGSTRTDEVSAAEKMLKAGIRGVRYLDANSRRPIITTGYKNIDIDLARFGGDWARYRAENKGKSAALDKAIADIDAHGGPKMGPQTGNYVVFDPDDIEITEKNDKPVKPQAHDAEPLSREEFKRLWLQRAVRSLPGRDLAPKGHEASAVALDFDPSEPRNEKGEWAGVSAGEQVKSAAFKRWFGGSKVVDKNGDPLVVYHSSTADFEAFKRRGSDIGIHFGTIEQANDRFELKRESDPYASELRGAAPSIYPVFLSIRNPLRMRDLGAWDADNLEFGLRDVGFSEHDIYGNQALRIASSSSGKVAAIRDLIESHGYDGIVYKNTGEVGGGAGFRRAQSEASAALSASQARRKKSQSSFDKEDQETPEYKAFSAVNEAYRVFRETNGEDSYIAFHPQQIKSALGNKGTFDPKSSKMNDFDPGEPRDPHGMWTKTAEYEALVAKQRLLEGVKAALKDPETGTVYTGETHGAALRAAPPDAQKRMSAYISNGNFERATIAGFVDEYGNWITRRQMEEKSGNYMYGGHAEGLAYLAGQNRSLIQQFHQHDAALLADMAKPSVDPTGTTDLRNAFFGRLNQRWTKVRGILRDAAKKGELMALPSDDVSEFAKWFAAIEAQAIIGGSGAWLQPYVAEAYQRGLKRARGLVGKVDVEDRSGLIASATVTELQGVCDAVSQQASRLVVNGALSHVRPARVARQIDERIVAIGVARSRALVSFAIVKAFNSATLQVFRAAGVEQVGTVAEAVTHEPAEMVDALFDAARVKPQHRHPRSGKFITKAQAALEVRRQAKSGRFRAFKKPPTTREMARIMKAEAALSTMGEVDVLTAEDDLVCKRCQRISDSGPYDIDAAEGLIPAHPHCRCVFIPAGSMELG